MFRVTKDWINKHKTEKGAWTKSQINALGLYWPPRKGWIDDLHETYIFTENARLFENTNIPNKKQVREVLSIDNCIAYLFKNIDKLHAEEFIKIVNLKTKYLDLRRNTNDKC